MILNNLDRYNQKENFTSQTNITRSSPFIFELLDNLTNSNEIQKFRAEQFSAQFDIQFSSGLDQDSYDLACKHAILRDSWSNEIVAYTRIQFFRGNEVKRSYSQHEFCIENCFLNTDRIVEIGRTCVHSRYRSSRALSILWKNIFHEVVLRMKANYLMGCVSIKLLGNEAKVYCTHQYIQQLAFNQSCNIQSKNVFEPNYPNYSLPLDEKIPKLFSIYLKMNGRLSKQAYYDHEFNCLDYFVLMNVHQMNKIF